MPVDTCGCRLEGKNGSMRRVKRAAIRAEREIPIVMKKDAPPWQPRSLLPITICVCMHARLFCAKPPRGFAARVNFTFHRDCFLVRQPRQRVEWPRGETQIKILPRCQSIMITTHDRGANSSTDEDHRFLSERIAEGIPSSHSVPIPPGVRQLSKRLLLLLGQIAEHLLTLSTIFPLSRGNDPSR